MKKEIIIVGGGISGLSVLHYLRKKYKDSSGVDVRLLEKNPHLGGTIQSIYEDNCIFETGPNGFLDSKENTLELIKELNLQSELSPAKAEAEKRFICVRNRLFELPSTPVAFFKFPLLSLLDKLRLLREPFVPKGNNPEETVYAFGKRRLGENFSKILLDPMVSGVFGGDAQTLNLKSAFPRIHEIEQKYGSLIRGMFALRKSKKQLKNKVSTQPGGRLTSFHKGMFQLIHTLHVQYKDSISVQHSVESISYQDNRFSIKTNQQTFSADEVFLCAPAYATAKMINGWHPELAEILNKIPYAPVAVVGLLYTKTAFETFPDGFGYLNPTSENKDVLGVLFSSNIFYDRSPEENILLRVMIGGRKHQEIVNLSKDELLKIAEREIETILKVGQKPIKHFFISWDKGIPQYEKEYLQIKERILDELKNSKGLHLCANYLNGISLNDCVANAKKLVEESSL